MFSEIVLASRTKAKCDAIAAGVKERTGRTVETAQVNADNVSQALIQRVKPNLVMNIALPYQDLHIMDACLEAGVNYLMANYEPPEEAKFEYKWQWAYRKNFRTGALWPCWAAASTPA